MSKKTRAELDDVELDDQADAAAADDAAEDAAEDESEESAATSDESATTSDKKQSGSASGKDKSTEKSSKSASKTSKSSAKSSGKSSKSGTKTSGKASKSSSDSVFVSGGKRPGGKPGSKSRKPVRRPTGPVKVAADKPWGTIALFAIVIALFVGIVGYTGYQAWYNNKAPQEQAAMISGILNYYESDPDMLTREHPEGDLTYKVQPPVGGDHNGNWQNCMGDVYDAPIAEEHAVHSLEHGAIWISYRPDLPKEKVDALAERVEGEEYMMMSPYPGLKSDFTVQAWGFKLDGLTDPDDTRIDELIEAVRTKGPEAGAACSGGITATGDSPRDVAPPQGGMPGGGAPPPAPGG